MSSSSAIIKKLNNIKKLLLIDNSLENILQKL